MKFRIPLFLLAFPGLFVGLAHAQQQTFIVNPNSSNVSFTLGGSDHTTHGTFRIRSGSVEFNRFSSKVSGSVIVAAGSGKTGNNMRDKKMWDQVLDAPQFDEITFAPVSYQGKIASTGDSTIQLTGMITLHGTPHPLTTPTQLHIDGTNCTAKTHFIIPYVQWGLKDPSVFILRVAKEVSIDLTLSGQLSN